MAHEFGKTPSELMWGRDAPRLAGLAFDHMICDIGMQARKRAADKMKRKGR